MTDTELTLEALQTAGDAGVHSFELNHIVGTIRAAARINDLKKLGYSISSQPEKLGNARGVRYFLVSAPVKKTEIKTQKKYIFDALRQVYIEVCETVKQPAQPIQGVLL